jgi:hypothetical protein
MKLKNYFGIKMLKENSKLGNLREKICELTDIPESVQRIWILSKNNNIITPQKYISYNEEEDNNNNNNNEELLLLTDLFKNEENKKIQPFIIFVEDISLKFSFDISLDVFPNNNNNNNDNNDNNLLIFFYVMNKSKKVAEFLFYKVNMNYTVFILFNMN